MSAERATRRRLRTAAMQALFQFDAQGAAFDKDVDGFLMAEGLTGQDLLFVRRCFDSAVENLDMIDHQLGHASTNWSVPRMPPVDRAILRLALCELLVLQDPPPKVIINEAVELAREYGAKESPQFVNGVLDAIWKQLSAVQPPERD